MDDGIGAAGEGHGGGDHLIAGLQILGQQGNVQGCRAGIHGDGVFGAHIFGELLLKLQGTGPFCQPAAAHGIGHGRDLFL